jgi:hypothetical protein
MEAWFARFKCFSGDESPGEVTSNRKEHKEKRERVAEMITYQLMQVLSGQTKPKAHMSAGLHGLIRDVVNASYDNGATSFQQQQLQAILLKTWTTLIARREVICNTTNGIRLTTKDSMKLCSITASDIRLINF